MGDIPVREIGYTTGLIGERAADAYARTPQPFCLDGLFNKFTKIPRELA